MKSLSRNRVVIAAVALTVGLLLVTMSGAALAQGDTNTGFEGLQGPTFTFGVILAGSSGKAPPGGAQGLVWNNYPYSITGYAMSKSPGAMHIWLSSASQAVLDLGFKPGDIITILCAENQVKDINAGDWVQIAGFTAAGQLVYAYQAVLPAPFSY
jgi:hypothetical protein